MPEKIVKNTKCDFQCVSVKYMPTKTDIRYEPLSPNRSRLKQFNKNKINRENINKLIKLSSTELVIPVSMEDIK